MCFLTNFRECLRKIENVYNISFENSNIVIAVSTGVDSSVLLDLCEKVQDEFKFNIIIAHVNHGKRSQSEIEEQYIREYALKKNINIEVLKLNDNDFSGSNFQEEARNKRIEFFKKVLDKYNTKYLFLAHHVNDEAETIMMHLMRNSSLDGICGMNEVSINKGYYFIRPLIDIKKSEIYDYANNNHVKYYEDYTNGEDHYSRNQVRHSLIDKTFVDVKEAITKYKDSMSFARNEINKNRDELINKYFDINNDNVMFDYKVFNEFSNDEKIDTLFEVLKKYNFSKNNIEEIIKILKKNGNVKNAYKNILIFKEYDSITICENKDFIENKNIYQEIVIDKEGVFDIDESHYVEVRKLEIDKSNEKLGFDISKKDIICYNQSMMPFKIRNKQDGDRIMIKGGTKKVNELLVDLKVPQSKREKIKVLIDKDGNIISVLGIRKSYLLNETKDRDLLIKTNFYNNI